MKKLVKSFLAFSLLLNLAACDINEIHSALEDRMEASLAEEEAKEQAQQEESFEIPEQTAPETAPEDQWQEENWEELQEENWEENLEEPAQPETASRGLVVIDAGHQQTGDYSLEPNGPGSSTMKARVTSGTAGRFSGLAEYVLNLEVALILETYLVEKGYEVHQIRSIHDVWISNSERAIIANELNADAFIRIHANGSENASHSGAFMVCGTANNPYTPGIYTDSRLFSECVLEEFLAATGAKSFGPGIWETDTMTGINWCTVPTTIIEMGHMTNQAEDLLMATRDYQEKMAMGLANGIEKYLDLKAQQ